MGSLERCVIWGDDPGTRQRLGAGVPGTPGPSHQGTAAQAAVPISSSWLQAGHPIPDHDNLRAPGVHAGREATALKADPGP